MYQILYRSCYYPLNQGSFKISLADVLVEGSNRSVLATIPPNIFMSCVVKSCFLSSSKYVSSNQACSVTPVPHEAVPFIAFHSFCHLSGNVSLIISCISPATDDGVAMMLVKGWLTNEKFKDLSCLLVLNDLSAYGYFTYHTSQDRKSVV